MTCNHKKRPKAWKWMSGCTCICVLPAGQLAVCGPPLWKCLQLGCDRSEHDWRKDCQNLLAPSACWHHHTSSLSPSHGRYWSHFYNRVDEMHKAKETWYCHNSIIQGLEQYTIFSVLVSVIIFSWNVIFVNNINEKYYVTLQRTCKAHTEMPQDILLLVVRQQSYCNLVLEPVILIQTCFSYFCIILLKLCMFWNWSRSWKIQCIVWQELLQANLTNSLTRFSN